MRTSSGVLGKLYSCCNNRHHCSTVDCFSMWTFWSKMKSFMALPSAPQSPPPQSSRSLTRPTCSTPCAPPPTMTLCCVSAGGATGDTLAPLPAWELNPRTTTPSETGPQPRPEFNGTFQEPLNACFSSTEFHPGRAENMSNDYACPKRPKSDTKRKRT